MLIVERQRRIVQLMASAGQMEAQAMARQLQVSRETIRRDLKQLEEAGHVRRVHGGAVQIEPEAEKPFRARRRSQIGIKRRIGRAAAGLLQPGQSCFVDAGTTTSAFASALADVPGLLVITNSVEVAVILRAGSTDSEIVLLGGSFGRDVPSTSGELTISEIGRFRTDFAILSSVGVDPVGGVTYHSFSEAEIARTMIGHAAATILLADRTKLGRVSRAAVCPCAALRALVTDADADATQLYLDAGTTTLIPA